MFVACGIWCLAEVSSVSPSSAQTQAQNNQDLLIFQNIHSVEALHKLDLIYQYHVYSSQTMNITTVESTLHTL